MMRSIVVGIVVLAATAQGLEAQQRAAGGEPRGADELGIVARVGSKSYTAQVPGTCQHEPSASIYGLAAALWMVQADGTDDGEIRALSMTLWRPKDGSADQVSIRLEAGAEPVTIEVNPRNRPRGAASVQVHRSGTGGKFEVIGKDASGTRVTLTISCPVFAGVVAEGG